MSGTIVPGAARPDPAVGLCGVCQHARQVPSAKGSTFWLCNWSTRDDRFPKYPRLPVVSCPAFSVSGGPA